MSTRAQVDAPHLWIVLARCHRAMSQIAERSIAEAGLGLSDFAALEALLHKGPLTITEIQAKVLLATGSMTAAVDRLERKGLLMRRPNPSDRRAKLLELTPKGKHVVETAFERHASEIEAAMAVLSGAEKRQLYGLLKKLGLFAADSNQFSFRPSFIDQRTRSARKPAKGRMSSPMLALSSAAR
jgi:MarR family transcriptional regulator, 2-MHQ and catechol-resistance regulon repressor